MGVNESASLWILFSGAITTGGYTIRWIVKLVNSQKELRELVFEHQAQLQLLLKSVTPNGGNTMNNGDIVLRTERKVDTILNALAKANLLESE